MLLGNSVTPCPLLLGLYLKNHTVWNKTIKKYVGLTRAAIYHRHLKQDYIENELGRAGQLEPE